MKKFKLENAMSGESCAGKSIIEMLQDHLDFLIDELYTEPTEAAKGRALGVAEAIAVIQNPYLPNVDAVRAEAMERREG